ncbi:MAG: hypothetical protein ACOZCP_15405 [Pseudomonadota bacterium]
MAGDIRPALRIPLLILGFVSLALGVGAGLLRLGWNFPLPSAELARFHGPLMVSGFFGTVIGLERAVALARRWAYSAPLLTGLGGLAAVLGAPPVAAAALMSIGSLVLLGASLRVYLRQRALFTFTLAAGALCWTIGNLLWLAGRPIQGAVPWWIGFLVLTIAGERLELSRFLRPSPTAQRLFAVVLAAMAAGIAWSAWDLPLGSLVLAVGLLALTVWLLRQDVARRTVKSSGLTRYIAVCLLSGYGWLAAGGMIMLAGGGLAGAGPIYDAALHALLVGFVFAMVFGHAPIIFPAVARVAIPYHPGFYLPLALLHASLLLRIAGDLLQLGDWRSLGGALNAVALLAFVLTMIAAVVRGRRVVSSSA